MGSWTETSITRVTKHITNRCNTTSKVLDGNAGLSKVIDWLRVTVNFQMQVATDLCVLAHNCTTNVITCNTLSYIFRCVWVNIDWTNSIVSPFVNAIAKSVKYIERILNSVPA